MQAGQGAQRQAEQAARAVEDARRKLAEAEQRQRAWEVGAEGERQTADVLSPLETRGWVVLHDLHWPGRPFANIDHIAVGPSGIFVVDSKNWSGRVEVKDGVLRQNGYRRIQECEGASAAAAAVAAWLEPQHRGLVMPVICLVGHNTPSRQPPSLFVCGLHDLVQHLTARPVRLTPAEVQMIAGYLRQLLSGARSPAQLTTAVMDKAGPAPSEAPARVRARTPSPAANVTPARAGGRPAGRPRARPVRTRAQRASRSPGKELLVGLGKIALILFLALLVAPRVLPPLAEAFGERLTESITETTERSPAPAIPGSG